MGEYTNNYLFYMPDVGEQGWGDSVNFNFIKLDGMLYSGEGIKATRAAQADTATKLTTARTINGTEFNGTANITTANWGTARSFSITDGTNTGTATSVNGSDNVSLRLPTSIAGTITLANRADKVLMYVPSNTQIITMNPSWTATYSGIIGIKNPTNYTGSLTCNGYYVCGIGSNVSIAVSVVAGATYHTYAGGAGTGVPIYGTVTYR